MKWLQQGDEQMMVVVISLVLVGVLKSQGLAEVLRVAPEL